MVDHLEACMDAYVHFRPITYMPDRSSTCLANHAHAWPFVCMPDRSCVCLAIDFLQKARATIDQPTDRRTDIPGSLIEMHRRTWNPGYEVINDQGEDKMASAWFCRD